MDPVVTHIVGITLYILFEFYADTLFYIHFTAYVFHEMYFVRNDEIKMLNQSIIIVDKHT